MRVYVRYSHFRCRPCGQEIVAQRVRKECFLAKLAYLKTTPVLKHRVKRNDSLYSTDHLVPSLVGRRVLPEEIIAHLFE